MHLQDPMGMVEYFEILVSLAVAVFNSSYFKKLFDGQQCIRKSHSEYFKDLLEIKQLWLVYQNVSESEY